MISNIAFAYLVVAVLAGGYYGFRFSCQELELSEAFASSVFWPLCVVACLIKGAWLRASRGFK